MMHSYEGMDKEGMILRIEKSSINDGDGMRTVIFMKGCPLRCQWCSTPESQCRWQEEAEGKTYGKLMTVEEVLKVVRQDSPFYFITGGGMSISGGELLMQHEFCRLLLKQARWEGINTAIETTFFSRWRIIEPILAHCNTVFVDLKFYTKELHVEYTGVDNSVILGNLLKTNDTKHHFKLIIRVPLIPGVNDEEEELRKMAQFCTKLTKLDHVQLLPYHRLGSDTYRKLGRPYLLEHLRAPSEEHMQRCRDIFREYLDNVI